MKLESLAKKPQLVLFKLEDTDIVAEYGEAIEFWSWDRQPIDVFMKLASLDMKNSAAIVDAVQSLVLDEAGKPILTKEITLPTKIMMRVITRLVEELGK